jgi:hypothetical protein
LYPSPLIQNRDLFPRECYDEFYYNIDKGVVDYNEFVKGNNGKLVKNHQRNGPQLRVMKRGRVAKVDAFLDALVCARGVLLYPWLSLIHSAGKRSLQCA